jgi:hypothetical protein
MLTGCFCAPTQFLAKILALDPDERLTIDEAFAHPWLAAVDRAAIRQREVAAPGWVEGGLAKLARPAWAPAHGNMYKLRHGKDAVKVYIALYI